MWRAYLGLMRKEFIQIVRDRNMLRIIFAMPIIQLILLGYAVNTDVKHLALDVYDLDQSTSSRELVQALKAGDYFEPVDMLTVDDPAPLWEADERFRTGDAELALIVPPDFAKKLQSGQETTVGLMVDGSDANAARAGLGYANQIVADFSERATALKLPVKMRQSILYNPEIESVYYMVPGIVATLLTMVTVMLTSMAIVREREIGTLEQLSVTPISASVLLLGKISTFALLGFLEMGIALAVGVLWFGVPFVGSPFLLMAFAAVYLLTTLGLGMLFSTLTSTQQQAMFMAWFFSVFAIMTSGFFTPISNMPIWMQRVTLINPMRYFTEVVRGIMMKGADLSDLATQGVVLVAYGLIVFGLSAARFKKRTA